MIKQEVITLIVGEKYDIRRQLGSGGMSDVYLAVDTHLSMKWALKRIRCNDPEHSYLADSIFAEADILRRIKHKNLVGIVDIFREEDSVYLVMEYVEGKNLDTIIKHDPEYAASKVQQWTLELLGVLEELHSRKPPIIYRDMKPENIMVRPDGSLCLIDFGTAKERLDNTGADEVALGTKAFAAPEQFEGYSDERSDIYSLGRTIEAIPYRNAAWKKILRKATADDPEKRFQSVSEFKKAVLQFTGFRKKIVTTILALSVLVSVFTGVYMGVTSGDKNIEEMIDTKEQMPAISGNIGESDTEIKEKYYKEPILPVENNDPETDGSAVKIYKQTLSINGMGSDPEIGIKGFDDFKVYDGNVTIFSYVSAIDLNLKKTVMKIERRGMDGEVLQKITASPGKFTVREEGSYKVILHGEDYSGHVSEQTGYFTIDKTSPVLMDFSALDKKTFTSISFTDDPRNLIRDYSFVTSSLTLNGKKYDGRKVTKPGRYILKMSAVDEAGHRSEEKAEFVVRQFIDHR